MKRIVLPILLLTVSSPAFAMWGWFTKKKEVAPATAAPTTEATISAVEPEEQEEVLVESAEEVPATVSAEESESEYVAPEVEKIALGGAAFARQKEMALIVAINTGDVDKVKQLIAEKVEVKKPFKLLFYAGQTPLEVILANDTPKKFEIAELLLNAGANEEDLNRFLQDAVNADDYEQVVWLVNHGAKDIDGKAFELIEKKRAESQQITEAPKAVEVVTAETAKDEKAITPTEVKTEEVEAIAVTSAVAPVVTPAKPASRAILTPVKKPAAAQPRVQEVKVEVTPKPKVILAPKVKPAAAQPRVQEVKVEVIPKTSVVKPAVTPIKPAAPIAKAPVVAPEVKKAAAQVLAPAQEGPYDSVKLARAISRGDVNTVSAALNAGVSATDTFKSLAFAGLTPLTLAFKQNVPNKLAIAELLLVNGAQVADLKPFLADAIKNQNVSDVEWLLNFGVEDVDGKGAELIKK